MSSYASLTRPRGGLLRTALLLMNALLLLLLPHHFATAQSQLSSTVYFRKRSLGNIFAVDSRNSDPLQERELDGTATASRFVALALAPTRLYWSDARSIRSTFAANGSDIRTEIGSLVRVRWFGVNFGTDRSDLQSLTIQNTPCVSVLSWNPTFVECVVALPVLDDPVEENDCVIGTTRGEMRGVARNNYEEMRASGLPSPIVERLEIDQSPVSPLALAIDAASNALFWSNAVDGTIYCSSLSDTSITAVQTNAWEVKGLVLLRWPSLELVFSLEGKGLIRRTRVGTGSTTSMAGQQATETLLSGLGSPRGLAVDPTQQFLYWTEKTGRIYRASLPALTALSSSAQVSPSPQLPTPQLLLTLPTLTRLDGIAVDDTYVYWCEANTNVVARATIDSFEREVLVGGTADSALSWPRSIALLSSNAANQDFFFAEYTGRISKGKALVLVDQLRTSTMKYVDQLLKQYDSSHTHIYALE